MAKDTGALFASTASYYARYRPGYPPEVFAHLVDTLGLNGRQRVLDLGCGPGTVAIPLAPFVERVVAADPQPEMIKVGARTARAAGVADAIEWRVAGSASIAELGADGPYDLVTMGSSFHWMDREAVLADLARVTTSEAAVVLLGDPPPEWGAEAPWADDIKDLRRRYLGTDRRAGSGSGTDPAERHEDVLRRSAFAHVTTTNWAWTLERTVDELVGLQFSYSFSSPALLGARQQDYASQVRDVLMRHAPDGMISTQHDTELIIARRR
ncbi:class I SAM-dependent methyltransferase [Propionibacteriaceae bacterium Y1700]|uniref:class I SAM-dependent methyltransferase n=1 Tax=Microlunatus sp. Y1700 TaxID=3418487 RepID=UPI003DA7249E